MRRKPCHPEWGDPHLLSFVTDASGEGVVIHADLAGVTMLIDELEGLREQLEQNDCPHTHLFSWNAPRNALTATKLSDQEAEVKIVHHVKICGWNEEWAVRHGLMPGPVG